MSFSEFLGIEVLEIGDGHVQLQMTAGRSHWSPADRLHGGILFSLLDTALGRAVVSSLEEGRGSTTIESKINFFRPVMEGPLTADARVLNRGRRTAYAEGEIRDDQGRLVARATGTFMLTETFKQSEKPG
ncbi:MAG: PaaI family thioesterase [Myxococcota bacterium]